jgi:hypothetical protein
VEFRAVLEVAPIETLIRLFLWFAEKAKAQGNPFSQKGEELASTKEAERTFRTLLGGEDSAGEVVFLARPIGPAGPIVAMPISPAWLIGRIGRLGGEYTVVAQVDQIVESGRELATMRLTQDVAATPIELNVLKTSVAGLVEPAQAMGVEISDSDASITGPALWLDPIAIYK